jgi:SNF2 family DNA or RNA helicase
MRWPVLVVAPTSVLDNWVLEFSKWGLFKVRCCCSFHRNSTNHYQCAAMFFFLQQVWLLCCGAE